VALKTVEKAIPTYRTPTIVGNPDFLKHIHERASTVNVKADILRNIDKSRVTILSFPNV
jgi:hypothetical protein